MMFSRVIRSVRRMIIFVGSKEKGYFCEDVAAKFDQAVEYIDTDIHIVNQIPEIMNY